MLICLCSDFFISIYINFFEDTKGKTSDIEFHLCPSDSQSVN